ncbi:dipeptidase [Sphingomonas aracearum]|uniref:Membrane dipeptidase n=1 Tax=Sphingomonas aracearum TaxID=2283317 RepID=A0A369VWN1_9SPHN|nr:dipeptidase [Sphingomonas aracearum]RDE06748.1 membrane dipeptidase [Sphingomonas aracearum]
MRLSLLVALAPLLLGAADPSPYAARIARILKTTPLIDGHNDWAERQGENAGDRRWTLDLQRLDPKLYNTDIARLRAGQMGGQFWSVWVPATLPGPEQVRATIEQISLMHRIFARYPDTFEPAVTAADVRRIHKAGRIASLLGVEGGGQIDGSFAVLRAYRKLGASYLTLTHSKTIAWADSATDDPKHDGLTTFGEAVVLELNRLGMLVDLSHVSEPTMVDALRVSKAPVIFSHSSAKAVCDHVRNVSDEVLRLVARNGGVVMVNYAPSYVSNARRLWEADRNAEKGRYYAPPYGGLYIGQPDKARAALAAWEAAHPRPVVTLAMVADHIDHIAKVAGVDHVGIGGDMDGTGGDLPEGLDGVDTYSALLAELMKRGWSDADIAKLAGGNVLRAMAAAEKVAAGMKQVPAATGTIEGIDGTGPSPRT